LNMRPKCVSSGYTVWQASQERPTWRAKLGTAIAGPAATRQPMPATATIALAGESFAANLAMVVIRRPNSDAFDMGVPVTLESVEGTCD
jgi:hypothetical protein